MSRTDPAAQRGPRLRFLWPALLFLSLGLLYMVAVPAGESPDEPGHLQCVEQVSLLGRLPRVDPPSQGEWWSRTAIISGRMCYHMPLYYLLGGGLQRLASGVTGQPIHFEFPPNDPGWNANGTINMFAAGAPGLLAEPAPLLALRLLGLGLGLVVIWVTGRLADGLRPGAGLLAMLLVAGWPQFVYMSRAVSNELLAAALGALALWVLVDGGRREGFPPPSRYPWAALLLALATLSKVTMLTALGALALAFALDLALADPAGRRRLAGAGAASLAILALGFALIRLQPTLWDHFRESESAFRAVRPDALTAAYWADVLRLTFSSGYARFGWMNLPAPGWQVALWWVPLLGAVAAGVAATWRRAQQPARRRLALLLFWLGAMAALYLRINLNRFQPQFRFILAAVPALAALAAAGVTAPGVTAPGLDWLAGRRRLSVRPVALAGIALTLALLAANAWLLLALILPTYP